MRPVRYAVIGDVGGHVADLRAELARLGADADTGTVPEGMTVVQVGDLVHRGPDSDEVIALVDRFVTASPAQWIQLLGNHEAQYLREPTFQWHQRLGDNAIATLRRWWAEGTMRVATAIPGPDGDLLLTHAGVTHGLWERDLREPDTAAAAATLLNQLGRLGRAAIFRSGCMLDGPPSFAAGPLWASAGSELVGSWAERPLPFSQVHGHSSCFDWQRGHFRPMPESAQPVELDHDGGHETVRLDGGVIIGIDPGHGAQAHHTWRAWTTSPAP